MTDLNKTVCRTLLCLFFAHLASQPSTASAALKRSPNVVLILTDDQGYGDLSCHGNSVLKTPHLDQMYRRSVRLTNFHVDPTCSPTRAALMTGRYSTRVGVWHTVMGRHMPRVDEVLMPQLFAKNGYATGIFGKWHLGDSFPFRPHDRGFHEAIVHGGGGIGQIPDFWGNDYFDDIYFHNGTAEEFSGYCTDVFFREAIDFIEDNQKRSFFVYLSTNAPHSPYRVPDAYSKQYEEKVGGDEQLAKFYGMIANLDENVGRLLDKLRKLKLTQDTLVIFMTDNGTARGATFSDYRGNEGQLRSGYNAGMRGRKGSPYEGGHRVPCFLHWPGGKLVGGRDIQALTAHIDLLPTLMELCQLGEPARLEFDGTSLVGLLNGSDAEWPERCLLAHHQELPVPKKHRFGCVMRGNWRLITRIDQSDAPRFELFDVSDDPGQERNVGLKHPDVVKQLSAEYDAWWEELTLSFSRDAAAIIGGEQNPTRLTCFEWHASQRWQQGNVRQGFEGNGFWPIEVAKPGKYEIKLRRWPEETGAGIRDAFMSGKAIRATRAKIKIGGVESSSPIPDDAAAVKFLVTLDRGPTRLQTWFVGEQGKSRGAYYAYIRFLSD